MKTLTYALAVALIMQGTFSITEALAQPCVLTCDELPGHPTTRCRAQCIRAGGTFTYGFLFFPATCSLPPYVCMGNVGPGAPTPIPPGSKTPQ
jgi:hypothetical protein